MNVPFVYFATLLVDLIDVVNTFLNKYASSLLSVNSYLDMSEFNRNYKLPKFSIEVRKVISEVLMSTWNHEMSMRKYVMSFWMYLIPVSKC